MAVRLATVARYSRPVDAQLAKSQLEARGIPAFLRNEASAAIAGSSDVDVQVPEEYAETAAELLAAGVPARMRRALRADDAEPERCLICRSTLVAPASGSLLVRVLRAIVLQVLPLPPGWLEGDKRVCGNCGHEWTGDWRPGRLD